MVPFSSLSFWFVCNELFIMFAEENGTIRDLRINLHNSVLFNFLFQKSTILLDFLSFHFLLITQNLFFTKFVNAVTSLSMFKLFFDAET